MRMGFISRKAVVLATVLAAAPAFAATSARGPATKVPRAVDLGITNSSKLVTITAWLRMHDGARLEQTVRDQQNPSSPKFGRFSGGAALASHAPTAAEAATVSAYLASTGLKVTGLGPNNLFVTARGTASQVQAALNTELHDFRLGARSFSSNTTRPVLPAQIQSLVSFIGGLNDLRPRPMNVRPVDPEGKSVRQQLSANPNGLLFSASCFRSPQTVNFSSADADATYTGNRYGQDATSGAPNLPPCGYQPSDIQTAYGLDKLYKAGLDGRGQTVAIVDAFGSTTIQQDVAAFSFYMGLPPADLTVIGTPTESDFSGSPNAGWADETTLDVEWVHAIAPRAKIVLVVAPDNSFDNLFAGIITASRRSRTAGAPSSWPRSPSSGRRRTASSRRSRRPASPSTSRRATRAMSPSIWAWPTSTGRPARPGSRASAA